MQTVVSVFHCTFSEVCFIYIYIHAMFQKLSVLYLTWQNGFYNISLCWWRRSTSFQTSMCITYIRRREMSNVTFIAAFAKLRKEIFSVVMSVWLSVCLSGCLSVCLSACPSVLMEQLDSHRTYFLELWYMSAFRKSVYKIQVSLKSDKNNWYFECYQYTCVQLW
jgi:hypothetical protein